jgi:zinc protease
MTSNPNCLRWIVFGLASIATAFGQAPAPERLHEGQLPNGLRYVIFPHLSTKRDASLHLLVRAGSLDERDDERGFAHFVEHMAFSGTRNYPPSAIRILLQRIGVAMGADLNATTFYDNTNYRLDLQSAEEAKVDEAFAVLRDFADGISFDAEQVTREARVVAAELKARESRVAGSTNAILQAIYAGTKLPYRQVGGLVEQIGAATPEQLRAFYRRTYQPDRMTILVVGPFEPAAIAAKVAGIFGSIPKAAEALPPPKLDWPTNANSTTPLSIGLPLPSSSAIVEFAHFVPLPSASPEARQQLLLQRLAIDLLNTRLRVRLGDEVANAYSSGIANVQNTVNLVRYTVTLGGAAGEWDNAVAVVEPELRRVRTEGFTTEETTEVATAVLRSLRSRASSFSGLTAARVAAEISTAKAKDVQWLTPADDLAELTPLLEGLTAARLTAAFNAALPADATQLSVSVPTSARLTPDRIQAALKKSQGRALRKRAAEKPLVFKYQDFGAPGAVAKRDAIPDLDLTLVTFANEVRLNLRPSVLEPERFRLRIVFPQNLSFVPVDSGGIAELAGYFLITANPKKHPVNEMIRLMRLNDLSAQFSVNVGTPILQISGPSSSLKFALQFLTATLTDLNLDDDNFRQALARYNGQRLAMTRNPTLLAPLEALHIFTGKDKRALLRAAPVLGGKRDEVQAWLRTHLINGPLEIGLVGDFAVDETINLVAATLGTVKKRQPVEKAGPPVAWPKKAERQETLLDTPGSTSAAAILWPVALPDSPRNNAALTLAADIYEDRMHLILRESLGANYSTSVRVHRDIIQRDFAFVQLVATFDPEKAREMTMGSIRVANQLAERGVLKEEFERLREPARARAATDLRDNSWWLANVAAPAQRWPQALEAARHHDRLYDEVSIEEVNAAARSFRDALPTALIVKPAAGKKK